MRLSLRIAGVVLAGVLLSAQRAEATLVTVDVAEVIWTVEGTGCSDSNTGACESIFLFTYLWTGPGVITITGSVDLDPPNAVLLALGSIDDVPGFDQNSTSGVPSSPQVSISFSFLGNQTLGPIGFVGDLFDTSGDPTFTGASAFFTFEYDDAALPVPEPSTLAFVTLGVLTLNRARARMRRPRT